jgi:hypothetical protein
MCYTYSLNPYHGCAFNCSYCYAPAFIFDAAARQDWGSWVAVKANAVALLRSAGRRGKLHGKNVYMSTVTDPYQPIERKLELTRDCLAALRDYPPRLLTIQTRSPLASRDIDRFVTLCRKTFAQRSCTRYNSCGADRPISIRAVASRVVHVLRTACQAAQDHPQHRLQVGSCAAQGQDQRNEHDQDHQDDKRARPVGAEQEQQDGCHRRDQHGREREIHGSVLHWCNG